MLAVLVKDDLVKGTAKRGPALWRRHLWRLPVRATIGFVLTYAATKSIERRKRCDTLGQLRGEGLAHWSVPFLNVPDR